MTDDKKIDYILRTVEERDIRYLRLCFTDVLGNLKALSISPEELEEAFIEGIGFDGSSVDGFGVSRCRNVSGTAVGKRRRGRCQRVL